MAGPAAAGANSVSGLGESDARASGRGGARGGVRAGWVQGGPHPGAGVRPGGPERRAHPHNQTCRITRAVCLRACTPAEPQALPLLPLTGSPLCTVSAAAAARTAGRHATPARPGAHAGRHARGVALIGPVGGVTLPLVPLPPDLTWRCRVIVPPSPPALPLWAHLAPPRRGRCSLHEAAALLLPLSLSLVEGARGQGRCIARDTSSTVPG